MRGGAAARTLRVEVRDAAPPAAHPLLIAAGLAAGPAVVLGMARFAYGLLLPGMRADLHWSFAQAGAINTANAFGYFAGAMLTPWAISRMGRGAVFLGGMVAVVAAMLGTGLASGYGVLMALRVIAGVAAALVFITGMDLTAWLGRAHSSTRAAVLMGVYVGGGGLGIVLSGLAVPPILAAAGQGVGWRLGWLAMAALSIAGLAAARWAADLVRAPAAAPRGGGGGWPARRFTACMASYFLFGVGYISYITFVVALLVHQGMGGLAVGAFWVVLGLASLLTVPLWGRALGRLRAGHGPALVLAVVSAGAALPLLPGGAATALLSAVIFGGAFLSVVTAFTTVARQALPASQWGPAIAALTAVFAAGQCAGPVLTGVLSDMSGGVRTGLGASAAILGLAALVAIGQRAPVQVPT
ncbi:MAG TPA: YbfB/YjiJ family MFS transporter [Candidatus Dormibacteraeota bacterium]|nr:YbfB/YjiJ family MFS transporter [Candidatus Dormibacteraeota bacterium]